MNFFPHHISTPSRPSNIDSQKKAFWSFSLPILASCLVKVYSNIYFDKTMRHFESIEISKIWKSKFHLFCELPAFWKSTQNPLLTKMRDSEHSRSETYPKSFAFKALDPPPKKRPLFFLGGGSVPSDIFFNFGDKTLIQNIKIVKSKFMIDL